MDTFRKTKVCLFVSLGIALMFAGCFAPTSFRTDTTSSELTTEPGILLELGYQTADPNSSNFPSASPTEAINVKVYKDVEESLAGYKTFDFDYTNKANPLLEKELFYQLGKVLQAHGLIRVKENPQILISMDFFNGKKEQYTPPTTVTSTQLKTVWNTGMIGWNVGGFSSQVPVTSSTTQPGYTTISYYSNIRLNFLNYAKLMGEAKFEIPPLIWMGEADNEGPNSDIRGLAPAMFNELIGEFPTQTTKASKRYVRCFRYGSLGLGFDPSNWKAVRYVEPLSPAARQGIKPGDVLVKINGKSTGNWPTYYSLWSAKDPSQYRVTDPYYKYVLSNPGDVDVDVVIQSAETGKLVTLKMKPQGLNRYLEVNSTGFPVKKTTR